MKSNINAILTGFFVKFLLLKFFRFFSLFLSVTVVVKIEICLFCLGVRLHMRVPTTFQNKLLSSFFAADAIVVAIVDFAVMVVAHVDTRGDANKIHF